MHQYRSARTNRRLYFQADNNKGGFMHVSYKPQLSATSYRDLTDQIQFQSQEGKIWFGEQRMLLMHLSAMAAFRREVVNSMGIERAKGFFMRLRSEEHTSELQSRPHLVCRLLLEKK